VSASPTTAWFGSRGAVGPLSHLITPANRYASPLADIPGVTAYTLVSPRRAPARFSQSLLEIGSGGLTATALPAGQQHFVFVLEGVVSIDVGGETSELGASGFAYVPDGKPARLSQSAGAPARLIWTAKTHESLNGLTQPPVRIGSVAGCTRVDQPGGLWLTDLLPVDDPRHDFKMSILGFEPGSAFSMVEIHDEEHGLFMTAGGGLYLLEEREHLVERDDFIYMAPYCPQSFRADATTGAEYLLYKNIFRMAV